MSFFEDNSSEKLNFSFADRGPFILFLAFFTFLAWQITHPLMTAIIWAGMLSFIMNPVFKYIGKLTGERCPSFSAGITLCMLAVVFIVPLIIMFSSLGSDVAVIVSNISKFLSEIEIGKIKTPSDLLPAWTPAWIDSYIRSFLSDSESVKAVIQKMAQWTGSFLTGISKRLIQGASSFLFEMMLVLMVSFFFIRDGVSILEYIKSVTPLSEDEKDSFFSRARSLLNSVIYGILLTVAIQAILGGLGWWFAGLGSPAFFGMLMFFFGMFPAGTGIIWIPGSIYLFLSGNINGGITLLVWGIAVVGTIDNLLRPFLISGRGKGEHIPTLLIILGLFGGVIKWGFIGIFLGPLVLALFMLIFDIYRCHWLKKNDNETMLR